MARKTEQLTVGRRRIAVSNLDKILYPGEQFSKARVIDYYVNVSKYLSAKTHRLYVSLPVGWDELQPRRDVTRA